MRLAFQLVPARAAVKDFHDELDDPGLAVWLLVFCALWHKVESV
jgi:hypothetical protein